MKRLIFIMFLSFITALLTNWDKEIELSYNAKQLYDDGFKALKPLDSSDIHFFVNHFDVVSGWDAFQFLVFSYPLDTVGKNFKLEREKYIDEFLARTRFFSFPITIRSYAINCFLITTTDTTNVQYYRFLKVFNYDINNRLLEPIPILTFCEFHDGLSRFTENSDFSIYSNLEIESKFVSTREALDLIISSEGKPIPDTVIVKMGINESSALERLK